MRGRVASLLEVGTGFHPELSGRENILMNGAILGMTRVEIKSKFDEIVAFAEVEKFIDTPVKRYSSGMYVRLAFAVAAHLEPEILLVDEVLAVGDVEFQKKCLGKMQKVANEGRTVLFVSHNMGAISNLCDRSILLNEGRLNFSGDTMETIQVYLGKSNIGLSYEWKGDVGDEYARMLFTYVKNMDSSGHFHTAADIEIGIKLNVLKSIPGLILGYTLWSERGYPLAFVLYDDTYDNTAPINVQPGEFTKKFIIPRNTLGAGSYRVEFHIGIYRQKDIVGGLDMQGSEGSLEFSLENISGIGRQIIGGPRGIFRPGWDTYENTK